jgi:hypothetical protein
MRARHHQRRANPAFSRSALAGFETSTGFVAPAEVLIAAGTNESLSPSGA